jgi:hypothetical protein
MIFPWMRHRNGCAGCAHQRSVSNATLTKRVTQRETGSGLEWHLRRAETLAVSLTHSSTPCDFCIDTNAKSVAEIAQDIVQLVPWRKD